MTASALSFKEPELELDPVKFCIRLGGEESPELTSLEFRILALFAQNNFQALAKESIQKSVWGNAKTGAKTLNVHFTYLRRKLRPIGLTIGSVKSGLFKVQSV